MKELEGRVKELCSRLEGYENLENELDNVVLQAAESEYPTHSLRLIPSWLSLGLSLRLRLGMWLLITSQLQYIFVGTDTFVCTVYFRVGVTIPLSDQYQILNLLLVESGPDADRVLLSYGFGASMPASSRRRMQQR